MTRVTVREGCHHRVLPVGYDPKALPKGAPGLRAESGDIIEVTEAELVSFGDKFVLPQPAKKRGRPPKAKAKAEASQD